jgi:cytochrome c553
MATRRQTGLHAALRGAALRLAAVFVASAAAAEPPAVAPASADSEHGKVLYLQHCVACHGPRAWGDGPREIPALAAQHEAYLGAQLMRFASGERPGSAMHGAAMHDTLRAPDLNRAPAIRDLAAYLARAPAVPRADQGEGRSLGAGRSAYVRACAACHGEDGMGPDGAATPRIAGQHYRYLLSRLRELAAVHHGQLGDSTLSAPDQEEVADYLSRLSPPRTSP